MHTTLEHLEFHIKHKKKGKKTKNFLKEIKVVSLIFVITFVSTLVFTNAQLFFGPKDNTEVIDRDHSNIQETSEISSAIALNNTKQEEVEKLVQKYQQTSDISSNPAALSTEQELKSKLKSYEFDFNILPPTNRLIVGSINLDVPLVDSKYKEKSDFTQGNFDEELENGVVKYPTTPNPGSDGNTLLFGHTSQEWREHNPYGTVFSQLPKLEEGDIVKLIRDGKLYEYKVVEKIIVTPKNVNNQYQKYQDKGEDFLTLMGCYPLGRTDKRMMVTAERIK
ncbi:MAG TPA: sortase [Candidatus Absconditabacterales bacterium]|nr:sortase [Candidatus Absconditabacterales bacterium]